MAEEKPENRRENRRKANATSFKPGQSGNPGGRPKKPKELKEMADVSLPRLWEIAEDPHTKNPDRAAIYKWIYEQAYGKATQRIAGDEDGAPIITVTLAPEIDALLQGGGADA